MDIPTHYSKVSRGFWGIFDSSLPRATCNTLPFTADRYYESVHFSELALSLAPLADRASHVNWYTSAHIAAYIGIFDAAKHDVESLHNRVRFSDTPIYKELRATSETTDSQYKDPVNASRLYRALRNLRVHYGLPIVVLEVRQLVSESPHWYIRLLDASEYGVLDRPPRLSEEELRKYHGYLQQETIMDMFGRMLGIIRANIIETATVIKQSETE
jgi:hypothetical protein